MVPNLRGIRYVIGYGAASKNEPFIDHEKEFKMAYRSNDLTNMRPGAVVGKRSFIQTEHLVDYPEPDRVLSVTLNEAEQELLTALFYNAAMPEQEVIQESDWDLMVVLAKKLGVGDINQW
jgi:hypothetical protein